MTDGIEFVWPSSCELCIGNKLQNYDLITNRNDNNKINEPVLYLYNEWSEKRRTLRYKEIFIN